MYSYRPNTYAVLNASPTRYFVAIAWGDSKQIEVAHFRTYDVLIATIDLPTLLNTYKVTHLILFPDASDLFELAKKGLEFRPTTIDYRLDIQKEITRLSQGLQVAFKSHIITFNDQSLEDAFVKILKLISVKDPKIDAAAMLVLIDYLRQNQTPVAPQMPPPNVYL